jgi:hypothetical protein
VAPTTVLHPFNFSQLLTGIVGTEIARVNRIFAQSQLRPCEYEDPFGFGVGCSKTATVGSLEYEREYCPNHFRAVSR